MFVAMNRFRIFEGHEDAFETIWRTRDSKLKDVPGFVSFHLLRGATADGITHYISHSVWETEDAFLGWTKSAHFRTAHRDAGDGKAMYDGPPVFEGYRSVVDG